MKRKILAIRKHRHRKRKIVSEDACLNIYTKDIWRCIKENIGEDKFSIATIKQFLGKKYTDSQYTFAMSCLIEEGKIIESPRKKSQPRFFKVVKK
jgi:hypothetical protein